MNERHISKSILRYASEYPIIGIVGPRQSGKTTLSKALFPNYKYVSLESPDIRLMAKEDPRAFLNDLSNSLIIDEIQRVPELFSYLQELVDADPTPGRFIITGSQQFLLMEGVTQSLAGRIAIFHLLPFSISELYCQPPSAFISEKTLRNGRDIFNISFSELAINGFYPRIHDRKLDPVKWYQEYINTYVEKDVRTITQVADLNLFILMLKILAGRSGQIVNYASISNDIGISLPTVKRWISILETSGILFTVRPYHSNFGKRLIKSPKIFFTDIGILCSLLSITNTQNLRSHPLYGSIFENFIIAELHKSILHSSLHADLYFWRDLTGNEIDCLIEQNSELIAIEIKSSQTYNSSFKNTLIKWMPIVGSKTQKGFVVYDGETVPGEKDSVKVTSWRDIL